MRRSGRAVPIVVISLLTVYLSACSSAAVDPGEFSDGLCAAQVQPPPPRPGEGTDVEPPSVLKRVEPRASPSLRGRSATATVEAIIGEDGRPRNICVISGDPVWGRVVATALRQWRFKPGTYGGKPMSVYFTMTSSWRG